MAKRINIVLPEATVEMLDRVAPKGNRSKLIAEAVVYCVNRKGKSKLAEQVEASAIVNAERDLQISEEWFALDEEAWQVTDGTSNQN